ncbi:cytochrome c oxidase subunit 5B, mitochondrial-like [Mercenaria mercenaria]|uniref:cytochrome c oxidase subunit 5B, mitochondrial-like n=1 Tax=Mercenaria mercenaria TaxID=6596 RepID=UPI001E1DCBA3|nr:cytochrome c oxidase subunit 5B, mitochondrial-like [Mercenaria mercenaria]
MATLIRQTPRLLSRSVFYTAARAGSGEAKKAEDTYQNVDKEVPTSVEGFYGKIYNKAAKGKELEGDKVQKELGYLTGLHRAEMLERLKGVKDPFDLGVHQRLEESQGSLENPIVVPTTSGERLVGCVCEEDSTDVRWMNIYSGLKRQCNCGHWFQCVQIPGAHDH